MKNLKFVFSPLEVNATGLFNNWFFRKVESVTPRFYYLEESLNDFSLERFPTL